MNSKSNISDNKQSFYLALGQIIALLANFVIPIFLTRVLLKEEYGFYSQFNAVLFFLTGLFTFDIGTNLYYYYPTSENHKKKIIVFQTFVFMVCFSLLSALFIYIPVISNFILGTDELQQYKIIIYLLTIVLVITGIIQPLMVVKKDTKVSLWFPVLQVLLKALLIILFFLIIPGIQSIINSIIVSSVLIMMIVLHYVSKTIKELPGDKLTDKKTAIAQLRYNLPLSAALSLKLISVRFDKLISISFLSAASYASYSVAFFGIPGLHQIYSSISQVTVINMTKSFNAGDKKGALKQYKTMVVKTLSFSVPIVLIVMLFAKTIIIFLFTEKYTDATLIFRMYLFSVFFVMLDEGLVLRASGHTNFYTKAYLITAPVVIPATYFLVKYFGSFGAMSGALLSIILPRLYLIGKEKHVFNVTLFHFFPWKEIGLIFFISVLFLLPLVFLSIVIEVNIIMVVLVSLVYLTGVYIFEISRDVFIIDKVKALQLRMKYFKF